MESKEKYNVEHEFRQRKIKEDIFRDICSNTAINSRYFNRKEIILKFKDEKTKIDDRIIIYADFKLRPEDNKDFARFVLIFSFDKNITNDKWHDQILAEIQKINSQIESELDRMVNLRSDVSDLFYIPSKETITKLEEKIQRINDAVSDTKLDNDEKRIAGMEEIRKRLSILEGVVLKLAEDKKEQLKIRTHKCGDKTHHAIEGLGIDIVR